MSVFLGIDTSNYTTSAAIYNDETGVMINKKQLLPVEKDSIGLMQSKALFTHVKQLPIVVSEAFDEYKKSVELESNVPIKLSGVCVSSRPRNIEGSYMPVFLSGMSVAQSVATACNTTCYTTAHQVGHILAALYSANRMDLIKEQFLAFHVSGGTTECLLVTPDDKNIVNCEIVAKSLDLKAGQAVDRVGVMLGLGFPAGKTLDELSISGVLKEKVRPTLKGCDCCLSGLENMANKMFEKGESRENIARFTIEYVYSTINEMSRKVLEKYGEMPFVYVGGVMSNSIISKRITKSGGIFAQPEFSSDNASGVAVAAKIFSDKG